VLDQSQIFVPSGPVPRKSIAWLSVFVHCGLLTLIVALAHLPRPRTVEEKYLVTNVSGTAQPTFNPDTSKGSPRPFSLPRAHRAPRMPSPSAVGATEGTASETVLKHAKEATAAIMTGIKQRQVYGFSLNDDELPFHISGDFPTISESELPPHYEQLVIVEITIDVDGSVAQARIVAGSVDPKIQHRLLSAILGFKYSPAKRGGTPIASQLDLVVHVPS